MILSLSHRFIFVHVPKTAGWSMMNTLQPVARPEARTLLRSLTRRIPIQESPGRAHFRVHEPAANMIAKLSRPVWDSFTTFAVVRDPFEHAVSHYEYMKQFRIASVARRFSTMTFEQYLADRAKRPFWNHTLFVRMPDQAHFIVDEHGRIAVDNVLRFETLTADFDAMMNRLSLSGTRLQYVNKTKAKSRAKPYTAYYDDTTAEMVRTLYARDFDLFDYPRGLPFQDA